MLSRTDPATRRCGELPGGRLPGRAAPSPPPTPGLRQPPIQLRSQHPAWRGAPAWLGSATRGHGAHSRSRLWRPQGREPLGDRPGAPAEGQQPGASLISHSQGFAFLGAGRAPQRRCPEAALWGPQPAAQRPLGAAHPSTEHPLPSISSSFQWKAESLPRGRDRKGPPHLHFLQAHSGPPACKALASRDTGLFVGGAWGRGGVGEPNPPVCSLLLPHSGSGGKQQQQKKNAS